MTEIFKWGVSILLSLCALVALLAFILWVGMLAEAYPTGFAMGVAAIGLLFILGMAAKIIHISLFE